jgi:hypothetical protein
MSEPSPPTASQPAAPPDARPGDAVPSPVPESDAALGRRAQILAT